MSRIRTRHADPVAAHFYTDGHSVADFRRMGLEKLHGSDDYRQTMEQLWKRKLRTYRPYVLSHFSFVTLPHHFYCSLYN